MCAIIILTDNEARGHSDTISNVNTFTIMYITLFYDMNALLHMQTKIFSHISYYCEYYNRNYGYI